MKEDFPQNLLFFDFLFLNPESLRELRPYIRFEKLK